ncbi:MAG: hypothetical protein ABJG41_14850 [Cyclobacteriaceae bacterium]
MQKIQINLETIFKLWLKLIWQNWKKKIPEEVTRNQIQLEYESTELMIHAESDLEIQELLMDLKDSQDEYDHIKSRYDDYVTAEKAILSSRLFSIGDRLQAKFDRMKSKSNQQQNFRNHEKQQ